MAGLVVRTIFLMVLFIAPAHSSAIAADPFARFQFLHQDVSGVEESVEENDHFGDALASGDFNGDGYLDLAVGVPREGFSGHVDAGAVQVFYGSSDGLDPVTDQIWTQDSAVSEGSAEDNERFGTALAAGDFNGDGYTDLAISAVRETVGMFPMTMAGAVNVLYGSATGLSSNSTQVWSQNSPGIAEIAEDNDSFGVALTTGDFNGDGYADLAVGTLEHLTGSSYSADGLVHVLHGSASGLTAVGSQAWTQDTPGIPGNAEQGDQFGRSLAGGDFNADGFDDLAIGVPYKDQSGFNNAGRVIIIFGSASGLSAAGNALLHQDQVEVESSAGPYASFGFSLTASDFNGDGRTDLAVGVPGEHAGSLVASGGVAVFYGADNGLSTDNDQLWTQNSIGIPGLEQDMFGISLASGDFNGDGYADLFVGCPFKDSGTLINYGYVLILEGSASGITNDDALVLAQHTAGLDLPESYDAFGIALAAGDFDGDGLSDVAIGAQESFDHADQAGAVGILLTGRSRLIYSHVDVTVPWSTEVCAINLTAGELTGSFTAHDRFGALVGSPYQATLPARGRMAVNVDTAFSGAATAKYVLFTHDGGQGQAAGYTKFTSSGQYRAALPAGKAPSSGALQVPHIASDPNWWTGIGLVNLTGLTKSLTLSCNTAQTRTVTIPAHGQTSFLVQDLFGGVAQPSLESAVLENAAGIVGLELFGQGNQLAGIGLGHATAGTLYFPHIHSDATWWTGLVACNPAPSSTTLTVTPYSTGGDALSQKTITLGPKAKYVGFVRDLDLPTATAWLKIDSSEAVTGFELFGTWDGKLLAGFTALNLSKDSGVFPKIDPSGWTGISFVNTTAASITVTLKAYDDDGDQVATASFPLPAHAKSVDYVEDLFQADITAATYVTFSATGPVAGFQLNGSSDGWLLDGLPGM